MAEIVERAVRDLVPYARNPRRNDAVVDQMAASIREFGFKVPILALSDGTIVDGHLRLKAAQKLRIETVPVILCDEWTPAQVKAFRLMRKVKILGRPTTVSDLVGWSRRQALVSSEAERVGTDTAAAVLHRTGCSGPRRGRDSFADDTCRGQPQFRAQRNSGSDQAASR
jgi:hypothetical protein